MSYEDGFRDGFQQGVRHAERTLRDFGHLPNPRSSPQRALISAVKTNRPTKRRGKKDPKMARALKKANSMMRTKSGKLRKGKTQGDIMRKAHQLRRKM